MFRRCSASALLSASVIVAFSGTQARAVCLAAQAGNNCVTFDSRTVSNVLQQYTSQNQKSNYYYQIGFRSSNGESYSITNVRYSTDNLSFVTYGSGTLATGSSFNRGSIVSSTITTPFYVAYDLPVNIPAGTIIDSDFSSNSNGLSDLNGNLISGSGNDFENIERPSTSTTPVPAPLPIMGAAAAFSCARRLRTISRQLG